MRRKGLESLTYWFVGNGCESSNWRSSSALLSVLSECFRKRFYIFVCRQPYQDLPEQRIFCQLFFCLISLAYNHRPVLICYVILCLFNRSNDIGRRFGTIIFCCIFLLIIGNIFYGITNIFIKI